MIKHVILWTLKDSIPESEVENVKLGMKKNLEALQGVVPGLKDIKININPLPTSNADVMLDSTLESVEALEGYAIHPEHVNVADNYVRPYTASRVCMDFEV